MNRRIAVGLIVLNALAVAGLVWFQFSTPLIVGPPPTDVRDGEHFVTPEQLASSTDRADLSLPPFSLTAHDGTTVAWGDLIGSRPVVALFVKCGCPCNVEFETFFQRLIRAYSNEARFVGVIDSDVEAARRYAQDNGTPYPVLADPDRAVITLFGARDGCSVALVRPNGTLHTLWPGYSADMMRQLSRDVAALAAVSERPLAVSDMPGALRSGCSFVRP